MGVLTDLVVAPLADADSVATTETNERPWPWVDVKGLGFEDLVTIHCLIDRQNPNEPVTPPEWQTNPFTKEEMAVTIVKMARVSTESSCALFVWMSP